MPALRLHGREELAVNAIIRNECAKLGRDWLADLRHEYMREVKRCMHDDRASFGCFQDQDCGGLYRMRFNYEEDAADFTYYAIACANAMDLQARYRPDGTITVLMDNGSHVLTWAYPTVEPVKVWDFGQLGGR